MIRLLEKLSHLALTRPGQVLVTSIFPCMLLAIFSFTVRQDLSFTGVLDRDNREVARYFDTVSRLEIGGLLPLLVEGPEEKLDTACADLAARLEREPGVRRVDAKPPLEWIEENAAYLVDRQAFDDWLRLATHPDDAESALRLADKLKAIRAEQERLEHKGVRLVQVTMDEDPLNLEAGGGAFFAIDEKTQSILAEHGVTGVYAGLPAMAAQDQARTLGILRLLTPLSLIFVLFLFRVVEPSLVRLAAVALPMLLAVGATLGIVGALTGVITILESFFGVMVFGLGIDFALHLMVRLRDERAHGATFEEAMRRTLVGSGRGVVAGALTTAGAFAIVAFAPDPMALHLGISGAVGIVVCLILMITLLPALWVILERSGREMKARKEEVAIPAVTFLSRISARRPVVTVLIALAVLVGAGLGTSRFHFETDLSKVFNRKVPATKALDRLQELFGLNAGPWMVEAKDLEEAHRITKAFEDAGRYSRVESIATLLHDDGKERKAHLGAARGEVATQITVYESLLPLVSDSEAEQMRQIIDLLHRLERAADKEPPTAATLPPALRARFVSPQGAYVVFAYDETPTLDGVKAREKRLAAQSIHPEATSLGAVLEAIMAAERPWATWVFFGILLFVAVVLVIDIRVLRMVILAIVPVLLGTGVTFGVLCWADVSFNVLTTLVVPLIIGLGVDDGIHVVHRMKEDRHLPPEVAAADVGKAIVMTTLTTCVSFATLLFTDHPGMEGMGLVMLIGMPICLVASITVLPALAHLLKVNED